MPWFESHTDGNRTWKPSDKRSLYQIGRWASSTTGKGVALSSDRTQGFACYTDNGGADNSGDVDLMGGRFRHLIDATQSNSSQCALRGHLPIKSGCNVASGNYYGVRGYVEIKGTTSVTGAATHLGGLQAYIEHGGTTTIDAGLFLDGVDIYQVGTPTQTGNNSAVNIRAAAAADAWKVGVYMPAGSVKCGMSIGTSAAPVTTATTATNWIYVNAENTINTAGTVTRGALIQNYYNGGTTYASTCIGLTGLAGIKAGVTWPGSNASYLYGVQGQLDLPSTAVLSSTGAGIMAGVRGVITGAPTNTGSASTEIFCLFGENLCSTAMTGSHSIALLGLRNDSAVGMSEVMYINPGNGGCAAFIDFSQLTGAMWDSSKTTTTSGLGGLLIQVAGSTYGYIPIVTGS